MFKTNDLKTIGLSYEELSIPVLCLLFRKVTLFNEPNLSIQADTDVNKFNRKFGFTQLSCTCKCTDTSTCSCSLYKCVCGSDCFKEFSGTINVVFTETMARKMDHESRYWIRNIAIQAQVCVKLLYFN